MDKKNEKVTVASDEKPQQLTFGEEKCPRCGLKQFVVWGQTDCPECGLHFECC